MFHVFYVNKGVSLLLSPPLPSSVYELQKCIQKVEHISVDEQAIYLNCGTRVSLNEKLSAYPRAGSQETPMFLVRKITAPVDAKFHKNEEMEGVEKIAFESNQKCESLKRVGNYQQLLIDMNTVGNSALKDIEVLVRYCAKVYAEHRHLSQAWIAIVTNADQFFKSVKLKLQRSTDRVERFNRNREYGKDLLKNFEECVRLLKTIVIPSVLLAPIANASSTFEALNSAENMSLYDYIAIRDPTNRFEELPEDILEMIEMTNEADLVESQKIFDVVAEQLNSVNFRQIFGMEKRLQEMENKLQHLEANHITVKDIVHQIFYDESIKTTYSMKIEEFKKLLKTFHETAWSFCNSKVEVLNTILTRIYNFVQTNYSKLNAVEIKLTIFDEKYSTLKQRIDLFNQIKQAPIMYLSSMAEVIRRNTLQKEFTIWMDSFVEKSTVFIAEENNIRLQFIKKLEKHFLRQIFYGMYDLMPNIVADVPKMDQNLPNVNVSHLKELRAVFDGNREMQDLLRVSTPQVYTKLGVVDPTLQQPQQQQQVSQMIGGMRRDESFFVKDNTQQMDILNKNFPSTGCWLSEENISISPAQHFLMGNGRFSSNNSSLNFESIAGMSERRTRNVGGDDRQSEITDSTDTFVMASRKPTEPIAIGSKSGASSYFGTPEETFDGSFEKYQKTRLSCRGSPTKVPRGSLLMSRNLTGNIHDHQILEDMEQVYQIYAEEFLSKCSTVQLTAKECTKDILELKQAINDMKMEFAEEQTHNATTIQQAIQQHSEVEHKLRKSMQIKLQTLEEENAELKKIIEHEKYLRKEKESDLDAQKNLVNLLNEDLLRVMMDKDVLQMEIRTLTNESRRRSEHLDESDHSSIELKTVEQLLKRPLSEEEKKQMKIDIENLKTKTEIFEPKASLKNEYEKAYKNKMEFIVKGIEDKKNKEIQMLRNDITDELRLENDLYIKKMRQRIFDLEEMLRIYEAKEFPSRNTQMVDSCLQVSSDQMQESSMEFCNNNSPEKKETEANESSVKSVSEKNPETSFRSIDDDFEIAEMKMHSRAIQTRIKMRAMQMMINLVDIYEGSAVMIMWDQNRDSYIVFSTGPELYFVKEKSLPRLGINLKEKTRRSWMFAIVVSIEVCRIKKEQNRYNLPLNSRFNSVAVDQLIVPDQLSHYSSSSISTSKH